MPSNDASDVLLPSKNVNKTNGGIGTVCVQPIRAIVDFPTVGITGGVPRRNTSDSSTNRRNNASTRLSTASKLRRPSVIEGAERGLHAAEEHRILNQIITPMILIATDRTLSPTPKMKTTNRKRRAVAKAQ